MSGSTVSFSDSYTYYNTVYYCHPFLNSYKYRNKHSNSYSNSYPYCYKYSNPYSNSYPYCNSNPYQYTYTD
jgi:hypothetical protein